MVKIYKFIKYSWHSEMKNTESRERLMDLQTKRGSEGREEGAGPGSEPLRPCWRSLLSTVSHLTHTPTSIFTQTHTPCTLKLTLFKKKKAFYILSVKDELLFPPNRKVIPTLWRYKGKKKKAQVRWADDINYTIWEELRFISANQTDTCLCVANLAGWFV